MHKISHENDLENVLVYSHPFTHKKNLDPGQKKELFKAIKLFSGNVCTKTHILLDL